MRRLVTRKTAVPLTDRSVAAAAAAEPLGLAGPAVKIAAVVGVFVGNSSYYFLAVAAADEDRVAV